MEGRKYADTGRYKHTDTDRYKHADTGRYRHEDTGRCMHYDAGHYMPWSHHACLPRRPLHAAGLIMPACHAGHYMPWVSSCLPATLSFCLQSWRRVPLGGSAARWGNHLDDLNLGCLGGPNTLNTSYRIHSPDPGFGDPDPQYQQQHPQPCFRFWARGPGSGSPKPGSGLWIL